MVDKKVSELVEATDLTGAAFLVAQDGASKRMPATLLTNQPPLVLKQGSAPVPTAEGEIWWDADDDVIVIGTGASQRRFHGQTTGTWTPVLSATGATFNYAAQDGLWLRTGNLMHVEFRIQLATSGNTLPGNPMTLSGLPAAHAGGVPQPVNMGWANFASSMVAVVGILSSSGSTITMGGNTAAAQSVNALNASALSTTLGSVITGNFSYRV